MTIDVVQKVKNPELAERESGVVSAFVNNILEWSVEDILRSVGPLEEDNMTVPAHNSTETGQMEVNP